MNFNLIFIKRTVIVLFFFTICFNSKAQIAKINSIDFSKESADNQSFYLEYHLQPGKNSNIEFYKAKTEAFQHVLSFFSEQSGQDYLVKVLINKDAENVPHYFSLYFKNLAINELLVDGTLIKTENFYSYLVKKYVPKEKYN